jgi:hypothetical protein
VHLHLPPWRPETAADPLTLDRMMQAEYGIARRQTSFGGGPVDGVYPFASYLEGTWGAAAAIASLIERARTGAGQRAVVDPLHGAIVAATTTMFTDPKLSLPSTTVGPGGPNPAFGTYQCADGQWLFLGALGVKFRDIAFELLGTTDITRPPHRGQPRGDLRGRPPRRGPGTHRRGLQEEGPGRVAGRVHPGRLPGQPGRRPRPLARPPAGHRAGAAGRARRPPRRPRGHRRQPGALLRLP